MRTRSWVLVASSIAAALSILACVGDEPTTTIDPDGGQTGDVGQPCFTNGTCNGALSCISNVCVDLDSGAGTDGGGNGDGGTGPNDSGPVDGSGADGASGLYFDASCGVTAISAPAAGKIACGAATCDAGAQECCSTTTANTCVGTAATGCGGVAFQCQRTADCATNGGTCCLTYDKAVETCPPRVDVVGTACRTKCGPSEVALCANNNDCSDDRPGTCYPLDLSFASHGKAAYALDGGFCVPN